MPVTNSESIIRVCLGDNPVSGFPRESSGTLMADMVNRVWKLISLVRNIEHVGVGRWMNLVRNMVHGGSVGRWRGGVTRKGWLLCWWYRVTIVG